MSTVHTIEMARIDLHERLSREHQFAADALRLARDAFKTAREANAMALVAIDHAEQVVITAMEERMRALAAAIGSGKPSPETIDGGTVLKAVPRAG